MVTTKRQATCLTFMPPLAEVFRRVRSAKAYLRRAAWINLYQLASSVCSFVLQQSKKGTPSNVMNRLSQHSRCQPFDVQLFNSHNLIVIDEPMTNLVLKVFALIRNMKMRACQKPHSFSTTVAAFLPTGDFALRSSQACLRFFVVARVVYLRAVGERGKGCESNVYADLFKAWPQRLRFRLSREDHEPPVSLSLDSTGLNLPFDRTREAQAHRTYLGKVQLIAFESKPALWIGERIIAMLPFEARKACCLFCFNPAKKCVKGLAQAAQDILWNLRVERIHICAGSFDGRELRCLGMKVNRNSIEFPSITPLLKSRIIEFAACAEGSLKDLHNTLRRAKFIAERFHKSILRKGLWYDNKSSLRQIDCDFSPAMNGEVFIEV